MAKVTMVGSSTSFEVEGAVVKPAALVGIYPPTDADSL
jgi:hypothetical protein